MSGTSLLPAHTPFDYNVGINYDTLPGQRPGRSISADLDQITQYFKLIRTYQDTSVPVPTNPVIDPAELQVIQYMTNPAHPGLELVMGTYDAAVAVPGGSTGFTAGLMDSQSYTDAWVQMIIQAFGGTTAVLEHLKAISLGNELDNGDFVPAAGDPNYSNYVNVWIPLAIANLQRSLDAQGLGAISISTSLASANNQPTFAAVTNDVVTGWKTSGANGGLAWTADNDYPPPGVGAPAQVRSVVGYLQGLANQFQGTPEVFLGETGVESAGGYPPGTAGDTNEVAFYQSLFNNFLTPQQQASQGLTTPTFLFQAFDDQGKPAGQQNLGIFAQNGNFQPIGLKPGLTIPAWVTNPIPAVSESYNSLPALLSYDLMTRSTPSAAGLAFLSNYANELQTGDYMYSVTGVFSGGTVPGQFYTLPFALQNVYVNICAAYATVPGNPFAATYGSLAATPFLNQVYQQIFGAAPAASTVQYLLTGLPFYTHESGSQIGGYGAMAGFLVSVAEQDGLGPYPAAAAAFLQEAAAGTVVYGPELLNEFPAAAIPAGGSAIADAAGTEAAGSATSPIITITRPLQLVDPGAGDHTIQFLAGAGNDVVVLNVNGVDQISGFDPASDVLDLRALLSGASTGATALSHDVTVLDQGSNALIDFDPSGLGGGVTIAVLQGAGTTATSLTTLLAQGALRFT